MASMLPWERVQSVIVAELTKICTVCAILIYISFKGFHLIGQLLSGKKWGERGNDTCRLVS